MTTSPQSIALVGLSGGGKSTVARLLAARLHWPLRDTDALIEQEAGCTIAAIFAAEGEAGFRERETAALKAALADPPAIIATGGGIVLRDTNRSLLTRRTLVVWLDAPTGELLARLRSHDEERPLLTGEDPAARLETLRAQRAYLYRDVARLVVDTAGKSPETVAELIYAFVTRVEEPETTH